MIALLLLLQASITLAFLPSIRLGTHSPHRMPTKLSESEEKLVWDKAADRFYEANLDEKEKSPESLGEFCLIDPETGNKLMLTKEEKERIFLDSIQNYYFKGSNNLDDAQFDQLREDLSWEGSALVNLNRNETRFMNAIVAYSKGSPIISNTEFDELKLSLKEAGSMIAVSTQPTCYVDSGVCKVTWVPDLIRTNSLYVPASLFVGFLYLGLSYELTGGNVNPVVLLVLGLYPIYTAARKITEEVLFNNPTVAGGPCPSCGVQNKIFFGGVLGVEGDSDESQLKCVNCKTKLTVKRTTLRVSTLAEKPSGPPKKAIEIVTA